MKPCLVHKTSTSDEELQSNENHPLGSSSSSGRANEQPTHGILKAPSGKNTPASLVSSIINVSTSSSQVPPVPNCTYHTNQSNLTRARISPNRSLPFQRPTRLRSSSVLPLITIGFGIKRNTPPTRLELVHRRNCTNRPLSAPP